MSKVKLMFWCLAYGLLSVFRSSLVMGIIVHTFVVWAPLSTLLLVITLGRFGGGESAGVENCAELVEHLDKKLLYLEKEIKMLWRLKK